MPQAPKIVFLARPERLELPTYWFEASRSIHLSYGRANQLNRKSLAQIFQKCKWLERFDRGFFRETTSAPCRIMDPRSFR